MQTIKVKYKGLTYFGLKPISFTETYTNVPDFEEIVYPELADGLPKAKHTILQQQDEYIKDLDKSALLIDRDLNCIVNWEIIVDNGLPKETKKEKLLKQMNFIAEKEFEDEDLRNEFKIIYATMYSEIKNLSLQKQVNIVCRSLVTSYAATSNAYKRISEILSGKDPDQLETKKFDVKEYFLTK